MNRPPNICDQYDAPSRNLEFLNSVIGAAAGFGVPKQTAPGQLYLHQMIVRCQKWDKTKLGMRAKGEYPFRVIKGQLGHLKVLYISLIENTAQLAALHARSHLWVVRKRILKDLQAWARPPHGQEPKKGLHKVQNTWNFWHSRFSLEHLKNQWSLAVLAGTDQDLLR